MTNDIEEKIKDPVLFEMKKQLQNNVKGKASECIEREIKHFEQHLKHKSGPDYILKEGLKILKEELKYIKKIEKIIDKQVQAKGFMTVLELINHLKRYPSDMRVMIAGLEGGYEDLRNSDITEKDIILNYNGTTDESGLRGPHEKKRKSDKGPYKCIKALTLTLYND